MTIEELLLAPRYGWPVIPLERQRCTLAMASALALPGKPRGWLMSSACRRSVADIG
jgi:hypothetical protein